MGWFFILRYVAHSPAVYYFYFFLTFFISEHCIISTCIIWYFRRPLEEILKLLPGTHTESKRVRSFLACLYLLIYICLYLLSVFWFYNIYYNIQLAWPHCNRVHLRTRMVHHLIYYQEVYTWTSTFSVIPHP